jgi:hypothetical protein
MTRSVIFSHCSIGAAPAAVDLGFSKPSVVIGLITRRSLDGIDNTFQRSMTSITCPYGRKNIATS